MERNSGPYLPRSAESPRKDPDRGDRRKKEPPPAVESGPRVVDAALSPTFYHERGRAAMTNEELAGLIQAGGRDKLLELWAQVRRFALWRARRWVKLGRGVTLEDLEQAAFLGLLAALEGWRPEAGGFLTWYGPQLKAVFSEAMGLRTKRGRLDPLDLAVSLDAPLGDDPDAGTLEDVVEDPAGARAIEDREAHIDLQRLRDALAALPADQREAVRRRYWLEQTTEQIAAATGQTEKEVRKLEAKALRTLRHPSVSRALR